MPLFPEFALLNIDKPAGMTSHDVVAIVRRETAIQKVGHAGTLDPMATGVLVLCLGKATRLSDYIMGHDKTYEAGLYLGVETDTYDAEGQVTATSTRAVTREEFLAALDSFQGHILQVPPMYSAIKQGGQKLYDKARRGETVEREPRSVHIRTLELVEWSFPRAVIKVTCSAGTYVRSLAYDIGRVLGVGGHLFALRRLASGESFQVEDAVTLEDFREAVREQRWHSYLLAPDIAVRGYPAVHLDAMQSRLVINGGFLPLEITPPAAVCVVYDDAGQLLALMERHTPQPELWKPHKVFR